MKKISAVLLVFLSFMGCNDGDIIVTSFNLEERPLEFCGRSGAYVFFQIQTDPAESLSVKISQDSIFNLNGPVNYTLNGTTNAVNYRNYDGPVTSTYFCNIVPPANPKVITEYIGNSGVASLTNFVVLNDNDGLDEAIDNSIDNDGDGLPDYYDEDDDGDNVPTATELGLDPLNPKDTDLDSIPDYLDTDDDGDGILTIYEDSNQDLNPANDFTDANTVPDYLNNAVTIGYEITKFQSHSYTAQTSINLTLTNIVLLGNGEEILEQTINMGDIINIQTLTKNLTPEFIAPSLLRSEKYKPQ